MPVANITINSSSRLGPNLSALVSTVFSARDQARKLLELMNQQTDGSSYTALEQQFGLQAGQGVTAYNLLAALTGASGALEVSAIIQFVDRLG